MISNASPLIFLSKINQINLLKKLFSKILISKEVKEEVVFKQKPGSIAISNAIKEGWIKVIKVQKNPPIGIKGGESSVINLARKKKDKLIIDDAFATKIAKAFGIETIRTTTIIFLAVNKKVITKEQAICILNKLIEAGYYLSPEHYAIILTKLKT